MTDTQSSAPEQTGLAISRQTKDALEEMPRIDFGPVKDASKTTHDITVGSLQSAQNKLKKVSNVGEAIDDSLGAINEIEDSSEINIEPGSELDKFLTGNEIDRNQLGDPPLADSKDALLDRDRIDLVDLKKRRKRED